MKRPEKLTGKVKTDEQLFQAYRSGSQSAFEELFARHKGPLYTYCLRMIGEKDRAGDAFQETFFRAIKYKDSFDTQKQFSSWLFAIARNACRRILTGDNIFTDFDDAAAEESSAMEEPRLDHTEKETIAEALLQLPPALREAMLLFEYEGFTYEEIAGITNAGLSLVKVRIHRARKILRSILQPVFREERRKKQ
jgi:RNA polymerase sigma-70 factor (ECF subfamily)